MSWLRRLFGGTPFDADAIIILNDADHLRVLTTRIDRVSIRDGVLTWTVLSDRAPASMTLLSATFFSRDHQRTVRLNTPALLQRGDRLLTRYHMTWEPQGREG